jgi:hypothetical protein
MLELLVGSLKMNTALEYSTRVVQEGDRRCKKSTLNDLAYLTPLRIPLMNPTYVFYAPQGVGVRSRVVLNEDVVYSVLNPNKGIQIPATGRVFR